MRNHCQASTPRNKRRDQARVLAIALVCILNIAIPNAQALQQPANGEAGSPDRNSSVSHQPGSFEPLTDGSTPPTGFYDFRDDFDYSSIVEMQAAGWTLCGGAPGSYYDLSQGILTLKNDGSQGAAACWNNIPPGISDWTVTARVAWAGNTFGSLDMAVRTHTHSYRWLADGFSSQYKLFRDGIFVWTADGYSPQLKSWHLLRMDMHNGIVSLFFDQESMFNYTETDPGTYLADLNLSGSWMSYDDFDYVIAQQFIPSYPDFVATPQIVSQQVEWGETAYFPIVLTSVNSLAGEVFVGPSSTHPAGLVVSADPQRVGLQPNGSNTTSLVVSTAAAPAYQMYNVTTIVSSASLTHTLVFVVEVSPPPPPLPGQDFSLSATPPSLTIIRQTNEAWPNAIFTVEIKSIGGFTGSVQLSVPTFCDLCAAGISPNNVLIGPDSPASATLTVYRSPYEVDKTFTIDLYVLGTSAGPTHTIYVTVTFQTPSFRINARPTSFALVPGETSFAEITLTSLALSGFIIFNSSITPILPNGPNVSFSSESQFLPLDGTAEVTLTLTARDATPMGKYLITITGVTGSWRESITLTLYVTSHPYDPGIAVGTTARYTLTTSDPTLQSASLAATVVSIIGSNVSYRVDVYAYGVYLNSSQNWIDVATGETSPQILLPFFLIASGLSVGDATYLNDLFQFFRVTRSETSFAAGTYRSSIVAEATPPGESASVVIRWDRATGLLLTVDATFGYNLTAITVQYRLIETTAWMKLSSTFDMEVAQGFLSARASFSPTVHGGQNPYTYFWQFGDGANSTESDPTHFYSRPGNYTVTLRVTDSAGNTAVTYRTFSVGRLPAVNPAGLLGRWLRDNLYPIAIIVGATWIALATLAIAIFAWDKSRAGAFRPQSN